MSKVDPSPEFWRELASLEAAYREQHVSITLDRVASIPGALELWVSTAPHVRGEGRASRAVRDALRLTDAYGLRVSLVASPTAPGGPDASQLARWYEKLGFKPTQPQGVGGVPMLHEP